MRNHTKQIVKQQKRLQRKIGKSVYAVVYNPKSNDMASTYNNGFPKKNKKYDF